MNKSIAILLAVYNRKDTTLRCLKDLSTQEHLNGFSFDIYIVDGGSIDDTVDAVKAFDSSVNIKVVDGVFWNRGMYIAWDWAVSIKTYDYFLWLNDDTFLHNDAIATLLKTSDIYSNQAIIIGATTDTATHINLTYGGRIGSNIPSCNGKNIEVDLFNGNIVLIPDFVYRELGNLDYYFTHSKGDFDYGMRAKKAGVKMVQCGTALGECDVHPTIDKWCDPNLPLKRRWWWLHRPNGMPPMESYHLNRKHKGIISAIKVIITIHLRCLFPKL